MNRSGVQFPAPAPSEATETEVPRLQAKRQRRKWRGVEAVSPSIPRPDSKRSDRALFK